MTPEREYTRTDGIFSYIKDEGIDAKSYLDPDEYVLYNEWLKKQDD